MSCDIARKMKKSKVKGIPPGCLQQYEHSSADIKGGLRYQAFMFFGRCVEKIWTEKTRGELTPPSYLWLLTKIALIYRVVPCLVPNIRALCRD